MNFQRPNLNTSISCRRELLVSFGSSLALTTALCGVLGLVTLTISEVLKSNETWREPLTVEHSESEKKPAEPVKEIGFRVPPSPALPLAPLTVPAPMTPTTVRLQQSPFPAVEAPPVIDDLAWSDESFEPWVEEKKPAKKRVTQPVIAKTSTPAPSRKAAPRSAPKPTRIKAIPARAVSRSTPHYPGSARRSGKEGRVVVTVSISSSGKVIGAFVSSSSRNSALDSAALGAAKRYRFAPARNTRGDAVASKVALPFTFKLS